MKEDTALSEVFSIILIVLLVVVMAAVVFALTSGMLSNITKPTFIAPKISMHEVSGKNVLDLFNQAGDVIYLDVPHLQYNEMGVYLDTPAGRFRAQPLPGVDEFAPGTTLYVFKAPDGYRITDNPADIAASSAGSIPSGKIGVSLVDENSQTLIGQWQGTAGITPAPTPPVPAPVRAAFSRSPASGEIPFTVRFADASTGPVTAWRWDFGDGGTSVEQNPSHQISTAGVFTVSLTVSNATGGSDIYSWPGCVRGIPRADFSAEPLTGTAPLTVRFMDTTPGIADAWQWDFGDADNTNATLRNPVHTFRNPGTFTVKLTISGNGGTSTAVKPDYISAGNQPVPVAGFTGTPVSGYAPLAVQFADTSSNAPTAWQWDFGDGDISNSTLQNPVHRYAQAGSFTVTLKASNAGGTSAPFTRPGYIVASAPPAPPTISWVWPDNLRHGHSHKDVDVEGTGFVMDGTTRVILRHAGDSDIEGEWIKVLRPTHLIFDLDIPGSATPGDWDLIVINPDGQSCILKGGFEVKT